MSLQECYNTEEFSETSHPIRKKYQKDDPLAKVNYKYEKRQKELEKKRKKAEKIKQKEIKKNIKQDEIPVPPAEEK